ncbi:MAG TPA: zinc ribbon domain-containing protein [Gemmatimonadota bacterium]|nr:zinc ribbon domain-containing protein [Gemmatimonadota bacterium]
MTAYLLLATVLVALIVSVVATAVRDRADTEMDEGLPTPEAREREALEALRELEFDYETGVVTEEEYRRRRPVLAREAVDAHEASGGAGEPPGGAREAAAGRAGAGREAAGAAPAECPSCGAALKPGANFCARCGAPVAGRDGAPAGRAGGGGEADRTGRHAAEGR